MTTIPIENLMKLAQITDVASRRCAKRGKVWAAVELRRLSDRYLADIRALEENYRA
jgi:hypothetical protein